MIGTLAAVWLGLVVGWGAFAFGAVYPWAYWPLVGGAALLGLAGVGVPGPRRLSLPPLLTGALAVLLAVMALQVMPLPPWLLDSISPHTRTALRTFDVQVANNSGAWHALSVNPLATSQALIIVAAFVVMLAGLTRLVPIIGVKRVAASVAALGLALAIVGVAQKALFGARIYGVWTPQMPGSIFGPFVNKNHFAGWMLMAVPTATGWLIGRVTRQHDVSAWTWRDYVLWFSSAAANQAILVAFAVAAMTIALFLTLSRSGIVSLCVAVLITGAVLVRQRDAGARRLLAVVFLVALVAGAAVMVGTDRLSARFGSDNTATLSLRVPIWHDAAALIRDYPWTGSGVGTFGQMMLLYQTGVPNLHVNEAHNDYLQVVAEGGVLLAAAVLLTVVAFAHAVRPLFRSSAGSTYWIRLGAVTGLVAIALQSVVEFSLHMPGNIAMFVLLCAIALHRPTRAAARHVETVPASFASPRPQPRGQVAVFRPRPASPRPAGIRRPSVDGHDRDPRERDAR